jgi:predicted ATP-dependent protease
VEATGVRDAVLNRVKGFARERGFAAEAAMSGIVTIPLIEGRPIEADQFRRLPEADRREIERKSAEIQQQIAEAATELRQVDKDLSRRIRALDREVAGFALGPAFEELSAECADLPVVRAHIDMLREELLAHVDDFRDAESADLPAPLAALTAHRGASVLDRYRVNLLVDHAEARGAPVVVDRSPTYYNLTGRIDYRSTFGSMVTDFRHIKAGALHRANGGFLVLHAAEVLRTPFAWDALKSALTNRSVRIENLATQFSGIPTVTLRPEP